WCGDEAEPRPEGGAAERNRPWCGDEAEPRPEGGAAEQDGALRERFAAGAALVGAALLYGVTFPLVHDALADITPFAYLLGRFGIATLVLLPVALPTLGRPGPERRMLVRAGLTAGVILFGGYATQTVGLQYTSPSTSAFITGLYVVITPVIESAISRRVPRPPVLAGIVIATAGLYLLTGADVHLGRGRLLTAPCAGG